MGIFETIKITDSNNNTHELLSTYIYNGITIYLTRDNIIFDKKNGKYTQVTDELAKQIISSMNLNNPDVIEYGIDDEEIL